MNLFRRFEQLLPKRPLLMGTVRTVTTDGLLVELLGGDTVRVRGEAAVGERIFIRDGCVEGPAPALPVVYVEV